MSEPRCGLNRARIRRVNDAPVRGAGDHVLYWMVASRRRRYNAALQRAAAWSRELNQPLLVLEALRCGHRYANARSHRFVLDGMAANAAAFADAGVRYHPYVEPEAGAGKGLLAALAATAAVVVTDDFPCYFLPRMVAAAGDRLDVRLEAVDGNGLLPMRIADRAFPTAYGFRRFVQRQLPALFAEDVRADPLVRLPAASAVVARAISQRWPKAPAALLRGDDGLADLDIDHEVAPVADLPGGADAARARLRAFLGERLARYGDRNHPDEHATSGLSPYLHFGHIASHEVFAELVRNQDWHPDRVAGKATGSRTGWWRMDEAAEGFVDQLITWRELGFNMCVHRTDYREFGSLPEWARTTLADHAGDRREHRYSLAELTAAGTHDPVWNAAQRQLVRDGVIHNYLRMLWGKNIVKWTKSPEQALEVMLELNDRYAIDGRDPNSVSGIFWVLGRYDRPWGPEREVLGKVRYMTSAQARRKLRLDAYLAEFGG